MNYRAILLVGAIILLLLNSGCKESPVEPAPTVPASTLSGRILQAESNNPIIGAIVNDLGPRSLVDTTDNQGGFSFSLGVLNSPYNAQLQVSALGYFRKDTNITVSIGRDTSVVIRLAIQDSSRVISGASGRAASIVLVKQTFKTIALRGTGLNESSRLTFKVVDSVGNPVVGENRSLVRFTLSGGPGAGEFLSPASDWTNSVGEVSTTVTSGTIPGVLQVIASTRGDTVKASPVFLTAGGGFPDSANVSIAASKLNIAGRVYANLKTNISLFVGDRFGNPVADGTSVTFTSNGGIILPSATTKDGVATVELKSGGGAPPTGGRVTVTAQTTGDKSYRPSDSLITKTIQILFSGPTQYPVADTVGFTIPDGGSFYFNVTVADDYRNPLVEGSTITVSIKAADSIQRDLELTNNVQVLKDRINSGQTFRVGVHDKGTVKGAGLVTFGIDVKSQNGDYSNNSWFTAYVSGTGVPTGAFNIPAKIELVDSTVKYLYLAESNLPLETTKTISFIVKDAFNNPINPSRRAVVNFSFLSQPTGTTLDKTVDSTNSLGIVSVRITSGNSYGTARVVAQTMGESGIVQGYSAPILVARGLPDSNKIFLELNKKNMFNKYGSPVGTINVTLIDKDGFAAVPQDLVASTTGGYVNAPPTTVEGKTTITLFGSTNEPPAGIGQVNLVVPVTQGVNVTKSQPFMFSYAPIIYFTNTIIVDTNANRLRDSLADGGTVTINYSVRDKNGNPISSGNKIKVTVTGPAANEIELSGDIDVTTIDTQNPADANFVFNAKNKASGVQGEFTITITVTGESGTAIRNLTGYALPTISAQKIALASEPNRVLSVKGTGTNETSTITFQVTDLANRPIDGTNPVYVDVRVLDLLGGAAIYPTRIQTDANGKVTATLFSGTRYGTVRVVASFVSGTNTISSPQETFTIIGPHLDNFTLLLSKNNMPGVGNSNPEVGKATVTVADSLGGSLPTGTRVNFRTLSGGAVSSPAFTNANGIATASIKGGFIPNDPVRGLGYGTLQAWMIGNNGDTLKRELPFLLSGVPKTIFFTQDGINQYTPLNTPIVDGGLATVSFKIRDVNWRPVSNDYAITVTTDGDSGAIEVKNITTIRDMVDMNDTNQICSFQLVDKIKGGGPSGPITVTITVSNKDLGSYATTITGTLAPALGVVSTRVANLRFVISNPAQVYVQSTGLPGATTLTYALIDSNNKPVTIEKADTVQFSIINGTGQEWLSHSERLSDANGQVTTTFHTGTKSGTFTIRAWVKSLPTITANTDITVIGGYPVQEKFTISWNVTPPDTLLNLPGLVNTGELASINILALDQYSNPAKPTAIQFDETTAGSAASVQTDATGRATAKLSGGKPYPAGGFGYVKAKVFDGTNYFRDSLRVLFTGAPIITPSVNSFTLADGQTNYAITYTVADLNNNSMSGGTTITVGLDGPASQSITLSGHTNVTVGNNLINPTTYTIRVSDNNSDPSLSGGFRIIINVTGPNGASNREINGYLNPPATVASAPAQIMLLSNTNPIVGAQGTGSQYISDLTFVVLDVDGRPINLAQRDTVFFSFADTAAGGAYLIPKWAMTDNNGQASVRFFAGNKYGTPTIIATMNNIVSQPVPIRISGPSLTNFNAVVKPFNMPGLSKFDEPLGSVTVQLGDTLGNPVLDGTYVYFSSNGGMIPSSARSVNGSAIVQIKGGNMPIDVVNGPGFGTVTVRTLGNNATWMEKTVPFLFSGTPVITVLNVPTDTVKIFDNGYSDVDLMIADANGNPVASGNTINITLTGLASNEVETTPANLISLNDPTQYRFQIRDKIAGVGNGGQFLITITVSGDNGIAIRRLQGISYPPQAIVPPNPEVKKAAQIAFISATASDIYISGVGALENSVITYEVRDSLGFPVEKTPRYGATFSINFFPNILVSGGTPPRAIPSLDSTDEQGRLRVSIVSGTNAGVVKVFAQIDLGGGKIIVSEPVRITVHSGFPDQDHFSIQPFRWVFPTILSTNINDYPLFMVSVGDTFSNPVPKGTAVYFHSQAGIIQTGNEDFRAYTDKDGRAFVRLITSNPKPFIAPVGQGSKYYDATNGEGYFWVYAQTQGKDGKFVKDSVMVVWNEGRIITSGLPASITLPAGGTSAPFTFTVTDSYGNPLTGGTTISASFTYPPNSTNLAFDVAGSFSVGIPRVIPNIPDARFPGPGFTQFTLSVVDNSSGSTSNMSVTLSITIDAPGFERRTISIPVTIL